MSLLRIFTVCLLVLFTPVASAYANLLITPLQVVMEGRDRAATINLINNSDRTNTYRLLWQQFVQVDKLGGYAPIADAAKYNVPVQEGVPFLKDFAVFTPRQVTLKAREKQTVRIAVRRPADLPDGEYKSHLKFQVIPNSVPGDVGSVQVKDNEARFGARVNASFSIPIVYRVGEYDSAVKIGQPSFKTHPQTGNLIVDVPVSHTGIHGSIGTVEVFYTPSGGSEVMIGSVGNSNLFPEAVSRTVTVGTNLQGLNPGSLRVVYKKAEGQVHEHVVMDELIVPVSN